MCGPIPPSTPATLATETMLPPVRYATAPGANVRWWRLPAQDLGVVACCRGRPSATSSPAPDQPPTSKAVHVVGKDRVHGVGSRNWRPRLRNPLATSVGSATTVAATPWRPSFSAAPPRSMIWSPAASVSALLLPQSSPSSHPQPTTTTPLSALTSSPPSDRGKAAFNSPPTSSRSSRSWT